MNNKEIFKNFIQEFQNDIDFEIVKQTNCLSIEEQLYDLVQSLQNPFNPDNFNPFYNQKMPSFF